MDKEKVAQGLTILINSQHYARRVRQVLDLVENWEETPMLFAGALSPLNVLVDVGLASKEALNRLLELAESKRRAAPTTKRVDYQRSLMREKRERLAKAVQLEELVRGSPLEGDARERYKLATQSRWMKERNEYIAKKGDLSWKERNTAANEFWAKLDVRLEHELEEAKKVLDHPPVKRKRTVTVEHPKPVTALSKAMDKARRR